MSRSAGLFLFILMTVQLARGDELLYAYEGDVLPYEAGWLIYNPCDQLCSESMEGGRFVLSAPSQTDSFNYHLRIAYPPELPPPSLWVEWRFRSNHPIIPVSDGCDGWFTVHYKGIFEWIFMYGDAVYPASGIVGVFGLALDEFHTFRFESEDGVFYRLSVDGDVFLATYDVDKPNGANSLQFGGHGGCGDDWIPNMRNEWDLIRYGTIAFGERIIESDPPAGYLRPGVHGGMDRFSVGFDSPNYLYIDEISVEVSGGIAPLVLATKRPDNGPPDVVAIELELQIPAGQRTTFTFNDGIAINTVSYTFQKGDVNADGQWNLRDFAALQDSYYQLADTNERAAFDFDENIFIDAIDYFEFHELASNP